MEFLPIGVVALVLVWAFNRLVRMRNQVRNAWSDVDVQLRRRADLVPSLVEVVKGYTGFERRVLEELTEARSRAEAPGLSPDARAEAEAALEGRVKHLIALAEAYPELKASQQYLKLQGQLAVIENDLASSRDYYNAIVRDFNSLVDSFPMSLLARAGGFERARFFSVGPEARSVPEVRLSE